MPYRQHNAGSLAYPMRSDLGDLLPRKVVQRYASHNRPRGQEWHAGSARGIFPEQIVRKALWGQGLLARAIALTETLRELEVSAQTYQRSKAHYVQAKRPDDVARQ